MVRTQNNWSKSGELDFVCGHRNLNHSSIACFWMILQRRESKKSGTNSEGDGIAGLFDVCWYFDLYRLELL